jgi:hypothetical protein
LARGLLLQTPMFAPRESIVGARVRPCRVEECGAVVPPSLTGELLCLDHFIELGLTRVHESWKLCREGRELDPRLLDWLFHGAHFALLTLARHSSSETPAQREQLLELVLGLTNLQEYVRYHSVAVAPSK